MMKPALTLRLCVVALAIAIAVIGCASSPAANRSRARTGSADAASPGATAAVKPTPAGQMVPAADSGAYVIIDPVRTYTIVTETDNNGNPIVKHWADFKDPQSGNYNAATISGILAATTVNVVVERTAANGQIEVAGTNISGPIGDYKVYQSYFHYIDAVVAGQNGKPASVRIGCGFLVTASVATQKVGVDLSGLPGLSASLNDQSAKGTISAVALGVGITGINDILSFNDVPLTQDSIVAIQAAIAKAEAKLSDPSTTYAPVAYAQKGINKLAEALSGTSYTRGAQESSPPVSAALKLNSLNLNKSAQ